MRPISLGVLLVALCGLTGSSAQAQWQNSYGLTEVQYRPGSYLGVSLADVDSERAQALKLPEEQGVEITRVEQGSPAEKAGFKVGDVVLNYNGETVLGADQLGRLVRETPVGRHVKIQIWRDGKSQTLTVTTQARRSARAIEPMPHFQLPQMPNMREFQMPDFPTGVLIWRTGSLGIECEGIDSQLADYFGVKQGVLVRSVRKGSAAEKAGLKAGDVITKVDGKSVSTPRDITSYIQMEHDNKPVTLLLTRNRKELTLSATPSTEPSNEYLDTHEVSTPQ